MLLLLLLLLSDLVDLLLLQVLLVDELVFKFLEIFKLSQRVVKYPGLEELVAQTLVGLTPHRVLVHEGFQDFPDVLLA